MLPATATSIEGTVPPGHYRVAITSGGPCGVSPYVGGDITFTVR